MKPLKLFPVEPVDTLREPTDAKPLTTKSSALEIFTDFARHQPQVLEIGATALEADALMKKRHVNMKLVVNHHQQLIGILTSDDLAQQRLIQQATKVSGTPADVAVEMLMRPISDLFALDYDELKESTVDDVVETLRYQGLPHCLVVDHNNHQIRGVISARDIARRLHISLPIFERLSFVDIFNAIAA